MKSRLKIGYITGNFDEHFDGKLGAGYGGAFITEYAPNGGKISTTIFGTDSYHSGESITSDSNGALYVIGKNVIDNGSDNSSFI